MGVAWLGSMSSVVGHIAVATSEINAVATPTVVINEVLANAKNESSGEAIELWNITDAPIDIAGWILGDPGDGNDVITDTQPPWDIFAPGTQIPPQGFAIVVDPDAKEDDHPWIADRSTSEFIILVTISGDTTIGNGLTNASDSLFIKYGSTEIDRASWTSDAGDGNSWERTSASENTWTPSGAEAEASLGRGNNDAPKALFQCEPGNVTVEQTITCDASLSSDSEGSPLLYTWKINDLLQAEQSSPLYTFVPAQPGIVTIGLLVSDGTLDAIGEVEKLTVIEIPSYSKDVVISEIFANAIGEDGEKEWIELTNLSDDRVLLTGWLLDDGPGESAPYRFPDDTWIPGKSYLVLTDSISHLILNNSQDAVRLSSPDDVIVSQASYQSAPENQAWAKSGNVWGWTTTPTPGKTNLLTVPADSLDHESGTATTTSSNAGGAAKSKEIVPIVEVDDLR